MLRDVAVGYSVLFITYLCRSMRYMGMREGKDDVVRARRYGMRRAGLSRRITRLMAGEKKQGWLV